ncbi:MAG: DUF5686 family protein [Dysgonamonadaceae bacterium]|jgi:hypothetical protein|nr:DUF5686 family protein [Dysgonamonadaceae bacterium]
MYKSTRSIFLLYAAIVVCCLHVRGQQQPTNIRYEVLNLLALRYHPGNAADSSAVGIILNTLRHNPPAVASEIEPLRYHVLRQTAVDFRFNNQALQRQLSEWRALNGLLYRQLILPYEPWLRQAQPVADNPHCSQLPLLRFADTLTIVYRGTDKPRQKIVQDGHAISIFESVGQENAARLLEELFGDVDLFSDSNELLSLPFKGPLSKNCTDDYTYILKGITAVGGRRCYEIVFYCKDKKAPGFTGILYISADDDCYSPVEARFTFNNPDHANLTGNMLMTHYFPLTGDRTLPAVKKQTLHLGDDNKESLIAERTLLRDSMDFNFQHATFLQDFCRDSAASPQVWPPPSLLQKFNAILPLPAFRNLEQLALILLNDRARIGGVNGKFDIGPLTQAASYNRMEGIRLKAGGNTTARLTNRMQAGGYLAYGTRDKALKYRADLVYSLRRVKQYFTEFPKNTLSATYACDLTIPGQDLLTSERDQFTYSLTYASINSMSFRKIGLLAYENELQDCFSFKITGRYNYDEPRGDLRYMQIQQQDTTVFPHIVSTELQLSLRFSSKENAIHTHDDRLPIHRRNAASLTLSHRVGIKGLLGSGYRYHVTEIKGLKRFALDTSGDLTLQLSAGKVWNRVPFPLTFIPEGNQSYLFETEGYNCLSYHEFVTDNYLAGSLNCMIGWSPFKLFNRNSKIKTSIGLRAIYGPLSDRNNPELHPELFVFSHGINPLGDKPYGEFNIGLGNLFRCLRIEYVRRITYRHNPTIMHKQQSNDGSLFFTGSFAF